MPLSQDQKNTVNKFKLASIYANNCKHSDKKLVYKAAQKEGINWHNIAVADFCHAPVIHVGLLIPPDRGSLLIVVTGDFRVIEVRVYILYVLPIPVETGIAKFTGQSDLWMYAVK